MGTKLRKMLIADIAIAIVCLFGSLYFGVKIDGVPYTRQLIDPTFGYGIMTISIGLITFFGILDLPGGLASDGAFTSGRVRFAVTATLVVIFVVFFGATAFWSSESDTVTQFPRLMVGTLGSLLSIVIPFYFGATAAVEIIKNRDNQVTAAQGDKRPDPDGAAAR